MRKPFTTAQFLDVRTHGYFRVGAASLVTKLGDANLNALRHIEMLEKAYRRGVMFLGFPEMSLTGYTLQDGFFNQTLRASSLEALALIMRQTENLGIIFTVGLPLAVRGKLYNCVATVLRGRVVAISPKMYLANSGEFHDARHFAPGYMADVTEIKLPFQEEPIPFGADIIVRHEDYPNFGLNCQVCQTDWETVPTSMKAALANATVLFTAAASPWTVDKPDFRLSLARVRSATGYGVHIYASQGPGESTDQNLFDGHLSICERFGVLAEDRRLSLRQKLIIADVDLEGCMRDREREASFGQCAFVERPQFRDVMARGTSQWGRGEGNINLGPNDWRVFMKLYRFIEPSPSTPTNLVDRRERCANVFEAKVHSFARKLLTFPEDKRKIVVLVSGGQDSALDFIAAVCAMKLLGLPLTNVIAITMPGLGTTFSQGDGKRGSFEDACALIHAFGLEPIIIPIKELYDLAFKVVGYSPKLDEVVTENVQAWLRQFIARIFSCKKERSDYFGLVINTSNFDESIVGWSTFLADQQGDWGSNGSIPKPMITALLEWTLAAKLPWLENFEFNKLPEFVIALKSILARQIGAELKPTVNGESPQHSDVYPGPANLRDLFGYHFVRDGASMLKLARLALHAYTEENWTGWRFTIKEIKSWLQIFIQRAISQRYKSIDTPLITKLFGVSWSAHYSTYWPSDMSPQAFLDEVSALPEEVSEDLLLLCFSETEALSDDDIEGLQEVTKVLY